MPARRDTEGDRVLVADDFATRERFTDLTLLTHWGGHTEPVSGLTLVEKADKAGLTFRAIKMADEAAPYGRWDQDLRASTAFDYRFAPVDRRRNVVKVEFDAIWDELESGTNGKWGEANRLLVALMHEYPEEGPRFGDLARTGEGHPFGRPAYHFRIRNCSGGLGAMMSYGGGPHSADGEFEKYNDKGKHWWLPGFISSSAKGQAPGDEVSYDGRKDPYPKTPTQKICRKIASATGWQHITWIVMPERLELYHRSSSEGAERDRLVFFMDIPRFSGAEADAEAVRRRLSESHGLTGEKSLKQIPPLYRWFPTVEAIRFYFRGEKTYLANVRVTTTVARQ